MKIDFCCTHTKAEPWLEGFRQALPGVDIWEWQAAEPGTSPKLADHAVVWAPPQAFIDEQAAQCGYCTSGLLISATALLMNAHESVSDLQIRQALEPHLCRCGTHNRVLRAVKKAALQCGLKVTSKGAAT